MGRLKVALFGPIFILVVTSGALADPIISIGGGTGWQAWAGPSESGSLFFDNFSWDGPGLNVGCFIVNPALAGGPRDYWGTSTGRYDTSFYLRNETGTQQWTLHGGITAYMGIDQFGWFEYTPAGAGQPGIIGTAHALFGGASGGLGTTAIFTPTEFYGYCLASGNGETYTSVNNGGQFALFDGPNGGLWFGVEDLPVDGHTDWDYNDMIMNSTPVPEPSTLLLLATGLAGLGAAARRRLRP